MSTEQSKEPTPQNPLVDSGRAKLVHNVILPTVNRDGGTLAALRYGLNRDELVKGFDVAGPHMLNITAVEVKPSPHLPTSTTTVFHKQEEGKAPSGIFGADSTEDHTIHGVTKPIHNFRHAGDDDAINIPVDPPDSKKMAKMVEPDPDLTKEQYRALYDEAVSNAINKRAVKWSRTIGNRVQFLDPEYVQDPSAFSHGKPRIDGEIQNKPHIILNNKYHPINRHLHYAAKIREGGAEAPVDKSDAFKLLTADILDDEQRDMEEKKYFKPTSDDPEGKQLKLQPDDFTTLATNVKKMMEPTDEYAENADSGIFVEHQLFGQHDPKHSHVKMQLIIHRKPMGNPDEPVLLDDVKGQVYSEKEAREVQGRHEIVPDTTAVDGNIIDDIKSLYGKELDTAGKNVEYVVEQGLPEDIAKKLERA